MIPTNTPAAKVSMVTMPQLYTRKPVYGHLKKIPRARFKGPSADSFILCKLLKRRAFSGSNPPP